MFLALAEKLNEFGCRRVSMNPQAREITEYLFGPDVSGSETRAEALILRAIGLPTYVFWPVFLETWSRCDCIWPYGRRIADMLRSHQRVQIARSYLDNEAARFFDALPPLIAVYRGCARYRVRGLAWSTDRKIGEWFAKGDRFNPIDRFDNEPDRVLATAIIPKENVFACFTDRTESEIVCDPRRLRKLQIKTYC